MQTQVTCPQCRAPVAVEVHQIVDVGRQPALKQALLAGTLNIAVCSKCGWGGQLGMPLVYHDPAHDLLISFVPMELNLPLQEQERVIGQMVRQVVDNTPQEKRRAYMLQPQQMFRYQTLLEKVLETEGVTPEMIARQREQVALLRQMLTTEGDALTALIEDNQDKLDALFLSLLQSALESAVQENRRPESVTLTNLQARLLDETPAGRQWLKQRVALHAFDQEARQANGLTPDLLLKHILANKEDAAVWEAVASAGSAGLSYEFFSLLSQEVEKAARNRNKPLVTQLTEMRSRLLKLYDAMQAASKRALEAANETLQALLRAPDKAAEVLARFDEIDDTFLFVLNSALEQAETNKRPDLVAALTEVEEAVSLVVQEGIPESVRFASHLLMLDSAESVRHILDNNPEMVNQELLSVLAGLAQDNEGDPSLAARARQLQSLVAMRMKR